MEGHKKQPCEQPEGGSDGCHGTHDKDLLLYHVDPKVVRSTNGSRVLTERQKEVKRTPAVRIAPMMADAVEENCRLAYIDSLLCPIANEDDACRQRQNRKQQPILNLIQVVLWIRAQKNYESPRWIHGDNSIERR